MIAGADGVETALPAGGRGSIALALTERTGGPIGPSTHVTDIKTAPPDVTVGTSMDAHLSAVAVCDVDDDGRPDLVIGAPQAGNLGLQSVGAVYVLLGGGGLGSEIDLGNPATAMEFHFFGQDPGDQLGAAVACADLTKDGVGRSDRRRAGRRQRLRGDRRPGHPQPDDHAGHDRRRPLPTSPGARRPAEPSAPCSSPQI